MSFTPRQGQFLAFIHLYRKLHRRGPAEADLVTFFRVTPPAAHGMVVKLEELGLITREAGVARSMRVAIPAESLPELDDVAGPPWCGDVVCAEACGWQVPRLRRISSRAPRRSGRSQ